MVGKSSLLSFSLRSFVSQLATRQLSLHHLVGFLVELFETRNRKIELAAIAFRSFESMTKIVGLKSRSFIQ